MRIDPETYLYPFIERWPVPSKTAETLIVRRDGKDVLFLNELRFRKNTALNLRYPIDTNKDLPAVKAVLGQTGIVDGRDYRGVSVLAYVCAIADSPWFLIARIDASEVYNPMRQQLWYLLWLVISEIAGKTYLAGFFHDVTEHKKTNAERETTLKWQQDTNMLRQSLLVSVMLEHKLKIITDGIVRIFPADFCRIWLIRPGDLCEKGCIYAEVKEGPHVCSYRDKCLHLMASSGRYTHIDGRGHARIPFGCYRIGHVASSEDHKFLTNDVVNDPSVHNREWARELGLVSFAGYQLKVPGGETIGVLALFAKHPYCRPKMRCWMALVSLPLLSFKKML